MLLFHLHPVQDFCLNNSSVLDIEYWILSEVMNVLVLVCSFIVEYSVNWCVNFKSYLWQNKSKYQSDSYSYWWITLLICFEKHKPLFLFNFFFFFLPLSKFAWGAPPPRKLATPMHYLLRARRVPTTPLSVHRLNALVAIGKGFSK